MDLLNEMTLTFENPLWALDMELAVVDTILSMHPEIYDLERRTLAA